MKKNLSKKSKKEILVNDSDSELSLSKNRSTSLDIDFKLLFESAPGLNLILNPDLTILAASNDYLKTFLTTREKIIGRRLLEIFPNNFNSHESTAESNLKSSLEFILKHGQNHSMPIQKHVIKHDDNTTEERYWQPLNRPVIKENKVIYIIHQLDEVTAFIKPEHHQEKIKSSEPIEIQQLKQRLLSETEEHHKSKLLVNELILQLEQKIHFRATLDKMLEGVEIIGFDWRYIYVNETYEKQVNHTKEELVGYTVMEKFPGIEGTVIFKKIQQCFDERKAIYLIDSFTFPDGKTQWFEMSFQPIPEGVFILSVDITERKNAEEKIKQSEKIYKTIASSIPGSVICLFDADFRYLLIEGDMLEKAGYKKETLLGNRAQDVLPPERFAYVQGPYKRVFQGESFSVETSRAGLDFITHFVPLKNENNEVYLAMSVGIDVTELKTAHRAISELNVSLEQKVTERTEQLARLNNELESFSYSISHDLRAPLRAVNGYAKMLADDYQLHLDENGMRLLGVVQSNALYMGKLIDELLAFSRLGRKEIHKIDVSMTRLAEEVVEEIKNFNPEGEIKINILHTAWGDRTLLRQVLFNYISNAVKYSSKVDKPVIEIKSALKDNFVIYAVSDNGTGFDMNYANKLFKVFQRLHSAEEFEGTGVGLA
ncbi:MAG TPA: PAS domain-containing protein, partial [Cyclobacteriaceae bacterium]|nr:PAS domain-containing protein [Cyclobacteriaceae bacterium]